MLRTALLESYFGILFSFIKDGSRNNLMKHINAFHIKIGLKTSDYTLYEVMFSYDNGNFSFFLFFFFWPCPQHVELAWARDGTCTTAAT